MIDAVGLDTHYLKASVVRSHQIDVRKPAHGPEFEAGDDIGGCDRSGHRNRQHHMVVLRRRVRHRTWRARILTWHVLLIEQIHPSEAVPRLVPLERIHHAPKPVARTFTARTVLVYVGLAIEAQRV